MVMKKAMAAAAVAGALALAGSSTVLAAGSGVAGAAGSNGGGGGGGGGGKGANGSNGTSTSNGANGVHSGQGGDSGATGKGGKGGKGGNGAPGGTTFNNGRRVRGANSARDEHRKRPGDPNPDNGFDF